MSAPRVERAEFTFLGFPLTDEQAAKWPPRILIRDERDGTYVCRERTTNYIGVPRRKP